MNRICAVLAAAGILGGLASAVSDWILGISKTDHDALKCKISAWIGTAAIPVMILGFVSLSIQLMAADKMLGEIMTVATYICAVTGVAGHIGIIQRMLLEYKQPDLKEIIRDMNQMVLVPTVLSELSMAVILAVVIVAVIKGALSVSPFLLVLNPLTFVIFFLITQKKFKKPFPPGPMGLGCAGLSLAALLAAL